MSGPDTAARRARLGLPLLSALDAEHARLLLEAARQIEVEQGERLIAEGAPAENMFLVLRGRFSVLAGGRAIAEIGAGEPIGEIGFFAGGTRSASVVALRNSAVLMLSRAAWERLARDVPEIVSGVLAALAGRLERANRGAVAMRPLAPRSVALTGAVPDGLIAPLLTQLRATGTWEVIAPDAADPLNSLRRIEAAGRKVLLLSPAPALLSETDAEYRVVPLNAPAVPSARTGPPVHLILWRAGDSGTFSGTQPWLAACHPAAHHHVALERPGDIARLARFIDGTALGLVLSGGGAQGTAHLGALKALGEAGVIFDTIGGTSAGAAMGAAFALERDADEVMNICEEVFLRGRAMGRYTLPRYSVLDPARFDAALERHFGSRAIEDLPLPYFAVATNLSTNDMAVLERGPLWKAVRASTSIPVVFPPWIAEGGEVLVDGALIDNAPILAMRAKKPGPAVLLNLLRNDNWRIGAEYGQLPGRAGLVWEMLSGPLRRGRVRLDFPTTVTVLSRTFNVNAQARLRDVDAPGDVLIDIPPLEGMGFLDWTRARTQFDASYRAFSAALEAVQGQAGEGDPVALLEAVKGALPWVIAAPTATPQQTGD